MSQVCRGENLRKMFEQEDFKQVWIAFGSLIKIRTVDGVNDIMEECKFSKTLKEKVKHFCELDYNWETIEDKGICYTTNTVMLHYKNGARQWCGYFQYSYTRALIKYAAWIFGTGILFCGTYYFLPVLPRCFVSLLGFITQNHECIRQALVAVIILFLEGGICTALLGWLFKNREPIDTLIAACILKKLEGIMGYTI